MGGGGGGVKLLIHKGPVQRAGGVCCPCSADSTSRGEGGCAVRVRPIQRAGGGRRGLSAFDLSLPCSC